MMSSDRLETLTKQAEELIQASEHKLAISVFQQSLQIDPDNVEVLRQYGKALTQVREFEQALEFFERSLQIEPNNPITLASYANVLASIGQHEKAFQFFEQSLQIKPNNPKTLNSYANALASDGQYETAFQFFERSLQIEPNNPITLSRYASTLNSYANALNSTGQYKQAFQLFERLLQIEPHNPISLSRYANALTATSQYKQAFQLFERSLQIEPNKMLTLNLSEEDYFDMVKTDTQSGLSDTEVLNRAMYHKIANEISILKGIAYRILRHSEQEDPLLSGIIQDIEDVFEEVDRRRAAQKSEIETIPHDHYRNILAVISKTAHDISDFVNNQLAIIESKTRRAMRKLQPHDAHYTQFEKLLTQLELTQTALSDLKAINEGITIKNHRFKVKKLFQKWEITPLIHQAQIVLDIQNGDSEFNGDEEKIKSALNELVENSLKHNSDQQNLTIRIASQNVMNPSGIWGRTIPGEQEYLFIKFADNGKGIPEDRKDWIFQPLKTTSQEGKGSGLGLFIIRKTLSKMNGYIRETGHNGARFEIYIPYTKEEAY